jgi:lipid A ethanolaminephosphotransferase
MPRRDPSTWNPLTLALLAALWMAVFANWPLWHAIAALPEMASLRGAVFIAGFAAAVGALTFAVLALFAWRWTATAIIALFLVAAAFGAHFIGNYGIVIDPTMMVNVLQTDVRETRDLLSWRLLASVLLLAGVPLWWLARQRVRQLPFWRQLGRNTLALLAATALVAALVFALFADLSATMRNHKSLRYMINPLTSFFSLGAVVADVGVKPAGPPRPIGQDATVLARPAGMRPPLLLFVVGETARADHFSLNGYARPTNAELATRGVVSFGNVSSCGTSTASSLPCMFSHLGKRGFESRGGDHENLLDLLQRAGLAVLWLDNQAGCKGLCDRIPHAMASGPAPLCEAGECLDDALLLGLDSRLAALPAERRARGVVLVLHQMGSHGPAYFKRSPANRKPFQPECTTNVLQQCAHDALINAYDNSIAYTDHVLAQSIDWLAQRRGDYDGALLYVSDHGESLGENNLYLHGLPYALAPREQTHVPMVMWLSPQAGGLSRDCVRAQRDRALSHDNLFHTVLGFVGVASREYQPGLDLLAACRGKH